MYNAQQGEIKQSVLSHKKIHVEEEVHVERPKVEKVGHQPPDLPLAYERPAEEQLRPRGRVQLAQRLVSTNHERSPRRKGTTSGGCMRRKKSKEGWGRGRIQEIQHRRPASIAKHIKYIL